MRFLFATCNDVFENVDNLILQSTPAHPERTKLTASCTECPRKTGHNLLSANEHKQYPYIF